MNTATNQTQAAPAPAPAPAPATTEQATHPDLRQYEVATITPLPNEVAPSQVSASALMLDRNAMTALYKLAEVMAEGRVTVPKHLQGSVGDCLAVCMQAMQWGMNPFAVAQKTHLINGTLGYEAQLVIAALNSSPALATRMNWRWSENWKGVNGKTDKDDEHCVEVWAVIKGENEPRELRVSMAQVGSVRNSPNWEADPRQQIGYLAAKRWGRLHAPDVILGVYTPDELVDGEEAGIGNLHNAPGRIVAAAAAATAGGARQKELVTQFEAIARDKGFEAVKAAWNALSKEDRVALGIAERDRISAMASERDKAGETPAGQGADKP